HRLDVHFGERRAAVRHLLTWHHLQVAEHRLCGRAAVGLHKTHDHLRTTQRPAPALLEHLVGLANAGRGAEIHTKLSSVVHRSPAERVLPVQLQVELYDVDRWLTEEAKRPSRREAGDERLYRGDVNPAYASHARRLEGGVGRADARIESTSA